MLGNLFRQRSHYVFDYKPRYYDERKERLKNLEKGSNITFTKTNLRSQWSRNKKSVADRNANRRIVIIIAILVGLVAYFFELHKLF